jgi:hypothetical protein
VARPLQDGWCQDPLEHGIPPIDGRAVQGCQQGDHNVPSLPHGGSAARLGRLASVGGVLLQYFLPHGPPRHVFQGGVWPATPSLLPHAAPSSRRRDSLDRGGGHAAARSRCLPRGGSRASSPGPAACQALIRRPPPVVGVRVGGLGVASPPPPPDTLTGVPAHREAGTALRRALPGAGARGVDGLSPSASSRRPST